MLNWSKRKRPLVITLLASKPRWVSLFWSAGMSLLAAATIKAVPALAVPVVATILPFAAPRSVRVQFWLGFIECAILLGFMCVTILSVGWWYLPSFVAAVVATSSSRAAVRASDAATPP